MTYKERVVTAMRHEEPDTAMSGIARNYGAFYYHHNFQSDIPTENIVAMYKTARSWKY